MKTIFQDRYERLNKAQKEAVDTIEGPVMVIAGPGTGKTSILTLRIANILQKTDTPASGILAITFTEAGVRAMRMKLREIIGAKADEVRIHTFHGFAGSIIHEFPEHFSDISNRRQLSDVETDSFIREILKDKKLSALRPFGNPDLYIGSILRTISDSKKEAWSPEMLVSFAKDEIKRIKSDESMTSTRGASKGSLKAEALKRIEKCEKTVLFAEVYREYEALKKKEKALDFDDQIIELILGLERDELLLRLVQEKFLYLFVDEHQDTNDSQNLLVKMIASFFDSPNLFVVGDEKQAVYRFQGASVENFLTFQTMWKSMKVISLTHNYRSHQGILDAAFSLIENNYGENEHTDLRIKLVSGGKEKSRPIEIIKAGNVLAAEKKLVDAILEISKKEPEKTVAVITRTNRDVERVLSLLGSEGIKAASERGVDIFSHPLGGIFFDLIEFLVDRSKVELFARTLSTGLWGISFSKSVELIKAIKSGNIDILEKEIPQLKNLFRDVGTLGSIEYLIQVGAVSGITQKCIQDPISIEVWRAIIALAQDIAKGDSILDPKILIENLLSYRASAETKSISIKTGSSDAHINVMTAHRSKGLEFDYVFIPYCTEESWMSRSRSSYFILPREKGEGDEIRDARRLFYVALTRAKYHVSVYVGLSDGLGKELTPLRFLDEIDANLVSNINISAVSYTPVTEHKDNKNDKRIELIEFAQNSILSRGLSVTALNHFITCPNLFFFKSILRVPEPPSPSSEKGNAMHLAMSRVWKLENKTVDSITTEIVAAIREYFTTSLLLVREKEIIVEDLIESAPVVAKALINHFKMDGDVLTETSLESSFEIKLEDKALSISLRGNLDAIVSHGDKVSVFDYKTKEAMSISAIRGETKSDDGGYFRQLIYYRILAENNSKYKGKAIEPALVFIKPDDKGRCPVVSIPVIKTDIERVKKEVESLIEAVWTGNILEKECDDKDCDGCKLKRGLFL